MVPLSRTGAEPLFQIFSQRYDRGSMMVTTNLPFDEWTEVFGLERLTGALLDRLTHHVHILEMNGESYRLKRSRVNTAPQAPDDFAGLLKKSAPMNAGDDTRLQRRRKSRSNVYYWH